MAQIVWTEPALTDLEEIAEFIALDKPSAASGLVSDIFTKVEQLAEFPDSGRKPPELPRQSRYRELLVGPCRIFYRLDSSEVYILYVMRSERFLRKFILAHCS